jgi:hypothetical protein
LFLYIFTSVFLSWPIYVPASVPPIRLTSTASEWVCMHISQPVDRLARAPLPRTDELSDSPRLLPNRWERRLSRNRTLTAQLLLVQKLGMCVPSVLFTYTSSRLCDHAQRRVNSEVSNVFSCCISSQPASVDIYG